MFLFLFLILCTVIDILYIDNSNDLLRCDPTTFYFDLPWPKIFPTKIKFENASNFINWNLVKWASKAPGLLDDVRFLMSKHVPFWIMEYVVIKCTNNITLKQKSIIKLLNSSRNQCKKKYGFELFESSQNKTDAMNAIITFINRFTYLYT